MKYLTCTIKSISHYHNGTRRIIIRPPEPVEFYAGQYLQLIVQDDKFPFSIASAPHNNEELELHIKPTPNSEESDRIEALLNFSERLDIEIPLGDCFITDAPNHPLILIAASTGVTQMKSIIEHLAQTGFEQPVYLYWGVLADSDFYLNELCETWVKNYDDFQFVPVVSETDNAPAWQGRKGLVGEAVLKDFQDLTNLTIVVSGSPGMVYATYDAFIAAGMPPTNMKSDIFSYAPRS